MLGFLLMQILQQHPEKQNWPFPRHLFSVPVDTYNVFIHQYNAACQYEVLEILHTKPINHLT